MSDSLKFSERSLRVDKLTLMNRNVNDKDNPTVFRSPIRNTAFRALSPGAPLQTQSEKVGVW